MSVDTRQIKAGQLSKIDKEILKVLLTPNAKRSAMLFSKKLQIPHTTISRRLKRLEEDYLSLSYSLNLEKFGWRRVDLLISTRNGKTDSVAKQLLSNKEVTYVGRSIGEHTIDLRVEIIVKDNAQLLDVLEKVKGMDGVNDAVWSEIVQVMGRNTSIPSEIIDLL
jgi:DNA-binding Lrp family transcriptional regulator